MKNRFIIVLCLLVLTSGLFSQQLSNFNAMMSVNGRSYLSISNKQVYTEEDATNVKTVLDFMLAFTNDGASPKLEWYNLGGKDGKVPEKLIGSATKINALSFDRDQFDKCKTSDDLKRMTGHITSNSFSHFAVISHTKNEINQHCFITETTDGKRALIWIDKDANDNYKVEVKLQS